jgi:SAM-dependent methyltransferase
VIGPLYEAALLGGGGVEVEHARGRTGGGAREPLGVERWFGDLPGDASLLARCAGTVLDVGSGPGRLTVAAAARGHVALGVDIAGTAVALTRRAGGAALRRDVFAPLPGTGRWHTVLLADGNIGIGGDPVALLRRVAELLAPAGAALVEVEAPLRRTRCTRVRLRHGDRHGEWFDWAYVSVDDIAAVAAPAGLSVAETWTAHDRWFTRLVREAS